MKLLIASDIHGSAMWCERLVRHLDAFAPDRVILLGDLLYHGPRNPLPDGYDPKTVAAMLNGIAPRVIAVRGNCDAEVDQMMLDFPCLADYALVADGETRLFCTHGHLWGPDNLPPLMEGDVLVTGHTHVKVLEEADAPAGRVKLLNPGSVSLPKDGTNSFATCVDGHIETVVLTA